MAESGRMRTTRNRVCWEQHRGFKSHSLRQNIKGYRVLSVAFLCHDTSYVKNMSQEK